MLPLSLIQYASDKIKGRVIQTPLIHSPTLSRRCGGDIYLKLENLQKAGTFKIRGASCKLLKLLPEHQKIPAEGTGAVPLAAILNGSIKAPRGGETVLIQDGYEFRMK